MALKDVIGQDKAIGILKGAALRGRLASAYLFAGEDGVGKKLTALNFAMALNCVNPVGRTPTEFGDACGACGSCRKIMTEPTSHPDVIVVSAETSDIKVEQIRRLEETISLKSLEARVKVAIVDEAERMNASAANAFLKTLEEPPASSIIVLISAMPDTLPLTIRSRCSRVNFRPLSPKEITRVLGLAGLEAEQSAVSLAMGRPALAASGSQAERRERFLESLRAMLAVGGKSTWKDRADIEGWMDMCMLFLRDMAVLKATGNDAGLINADMTDEVREMCTRASLQGLLAGYGRIRRLRAGMIYNLNKGITWNHTATILSEAGINV